MNDNIAIVYNDNSKSVEYKEIIDFVFNTFIRKKWNTSLVPITLLYKDDAIKKIKQNKILFWAKEWEIAQKLKEYGKIIHEIPTNAIKCEDKIESIKALKQNDISLPATEILTIGKLKKKNCNLIFPVVLKYRYSVNGNGVKVIESKEKLLAEINNKEDDEEILIQEYLTYSSNVLIKLFVTKNEVISGIKVIKENNGRIRYINHTTDDNEAKIAIASCRVMGLSIAGVDILYKSEYEPVICEVNTQPNLLRQYKITGINIINELIEKKWM